jgi:hypothetical protein
VGDPEWVALGTVFPVAVDQGDASVVFPEFLEYLSELMSVAVKGQKSSALFLAETPPCCSAMEKVSPKRLPLAIWSTASEGTVMVYGTEQFCSAGRLLKWMAVYDVSF